VLPALVDPEEAWTASTSQTRRLKLKPPLQKRWIALSTLPLTLNRKLLSSLNLKDVLFATSLKLSSTAMRRNPTLKRSTSSPIPSKDSPTLWLGLANTSRRLKLFKTITTPNSRLVVNKSNLTLSVLLREAEEEVVTLVVTVRIMLMATVPEAKEVEEDLDVELGEESVNPLREL